MTWREQLTEKILEKHKELEIASREGMQIADLLDAWYHFASLLSPFCQPPCLHFITFLYPSLPFLPPSE